MKADRNTLSSDKDAIVKQLKSSTFLTLMKSVLHRRKPKPLPFKTRAKAFASSLPDLARNATRGLPAALFGEEMAERCVATVAMLDFEGFVTGGCAKQLAAKGLGFLMILMSVVIKMPMIYCVVKDKSVFGLSKFSLLSDMLLFSHAAFYGYLKGR